MLVCAQFGTDSRVEALWRWCPHEVGCLHDGSCADVGAVHALFQIRKTAQQRPHIDQMRPHRVQADRRWPFTASRAAVHVRSTALVRGLVTASTTPSGLSTTQGAS